MLLYLISFLRFIISYPERGVDRESYLIGKSIPTQRVEGLKHNVFYAITGLYHFQKCSISVGNYEMMSQQGSYRDIAVYFCPPRKLCIEIFCRLLERPCTFQWEKPIFRTALDLVDEYPKERIMHLRSEFYCFSPAEMFSHCLDF